MTTNDWINRQQQLIREADERLSQLQAELQSVVDLRDSDDEDGSGGGGLRTMQLVLQFRLDTQDAMHRLFQFQQSLWQVFGISPHHSSAINQERLAYALGEDDLHHALSMLNQLIDALLRIMQRHHLLEARQKPGLANRKAALKQEPVVESLALQKMVRVVALEKSFVFILHQLTEQVESLGGEPAVGPVLDHIAQLHGPISRFFQAQQNGLILSASLYQQLEETVPLTYHLHHLVEKAHQVLDQAPRLIEPPRLFQPQNTPLNTANREQLEARASEKRLGYFFGHP